MQKDNLIRLEDGSIAVCVNPDPSSIYTTEEEKQNYLLEQQNNLDVTNNEIERLNQDKEIFEANIVLMNELLNNK